MTATVEVERAAVNEAVLQELRASDEGVSAGCVVKTVSAKADISEAEVRTILRSLLEQGEVTLGPKLRLVICR